MTPPVHAILISARASGGELEVRARVITGRDEDPASDVIVGRVPLGSRVTLLSSPDGAMWSEVAAVAGAEQVGASGVAAVFMKVDDTEVGVGLVRLRADRLSTPVPRPEERRET